QYRAAQGAGARAQPAGADHAGEQDEADRERRLERAWTDRRTGCERSRRRLGEIGEQRLLEAWNAPQRRRQQLAPHPEVARDPRVARFALVDPIETAESDEQSQQRESAQHQEGPHAARVADADAATVSRLSCRRALRPSVRALSRPESRAAESTG